MIRGIFFKFFFYLGFVLICIIFLPALIMPSNIASFGGKLSGYWAKFCLRIFLSTKIIIKGLENIDRSNKFFIACTHQSQFETFFLQTIFKSPFFILKKELIGIPIFGSFLKKIGCIEITRNKISKDNVDFYERVKLSIHKKNNPLIIFPQGTRYDVKERPDFKKGASRIYNLNIKCLPVVLNSGSVWPKKGVMKSNKKLIISILKPFEIGLEGNVFLKSLQNKMYEELDKIS